MNQTYILWIATFAYALHIVEEYTFDWIHFAVVNGVVIVLGISCASVGWSLPGYALCLPALMLINATFFHLLPFITTKGRFSPGLGTAVILFYPIAIWAYYGAYLDGVLSAKSLLVSVLLAAALMASPIIILKLRLHPYFRQDK